jgi:hypothetical protein
MKFTCSCNRKQVVTREEYDKLYDFIANLTRPGWQQEDPEKSFHLIREAAYKLLEDIDQTK